MRIISIIFLLMIWSNSAFANDENVLKIYHDADWVNNVESSEAIWRGMESALGEVDHEVNGMRIELVKKNHSANVTRSLRNMKAFLEDDQAIAVFSGMHSPPLLTHRTFINENKIPVLVPWAAGGPITRYPSPDNSIFRLSVDDYKAGEAMVTHSVSQYNCSKPYLLLENTPWGDSNAKSIKTALDKRGLAAIGVKRFDWSMRKHVASSFLMDVLRGEAECIIMVSNVSEGAQITLAMSEQDEADRIPLISHWGITGGNFHETVNADARKNLNLDIIQTCFSFLDTPLSPVAETVFENLKASHGETIKSAADIKSPAGFIHAYDLTKIFIAALHNVELTDDIKTNRDLLRDALETLEEPVIGLIKTYNTPFGKYSADKPNAHEALGRDDICMGAFGANDEIILIVKDGQ